MKAATESLKTLQRTEYIHRARMLQLTEGQLKLAMELNSTQQAINRTMQLVNEHSDMIQNHDDAIRRVGAFSNLIMNSSTDLCMMWKAIFHIPRLKIF